MIPVVLAVKAVLEEKVKEKEILVKGNPGDFGERETGANLVEKEVRKGKRFGWEELEEKVVGRTREQNQLGP